MKNHAYKHIRQLQRQIKTYRAEKNWHKADQLKHKVRLAINDAKKR